jgi:catechol 2,3-dioxygenase-like lactoylglutathione lyase family enzyme
VELRRDGGSEGALSGKPWQVSPVLGVRNVREAAEYYRDVLGFSLDSQDGVLQPPASEPGGVYAIVKRPGVWIHFQIRRDEVPQRARPPLERDVYLYVDGLDALHAELLRRGAVIRQGPRLAPYGIREIEVEDLNGYRLTFGEIG